MRPSGVNASECGARPVVISEETASLPVSSTEITFDPPGPVSGPVLAT